MGYEEQDYETLILEKLEAMEESLKSFMSSLEVPGQKLIRRKVPVYANGSGTIIWAQIYGGVDKGDLLCTITDKVTRLTYFVYSPAAGDLFINGRAHDGSEVTEGQEIARIKERYVPV
ncbi:MAG: hypothetical protein V3W51_05720 [Candidatus Brocadiales bacterium]